MTKYNYIFIVALVATLGFACGADREKVLLERSSVDQMSSEVYTDKDVTVQEFVDWCADDDHKLNKLKEISDMKYNLSYLPAETMAFLELRKETYDFSKFQKAKEGYSEMTYFNFKIEALNARTELLKYKLSSPAQYDERVKYMAFGVEKDIYLVQGTDTLNPGLCHFERIFEVAPHGTLLFGFDNTQFDKDKEFTIVYNDRLFGKGFVKFNYKNKQLINLPKIIGI